MKRGITLGTLVIAGALAATLAGQQPPAPSAAALTIEKVRDNLFIISGAQASTFSGGNTAVFVQASGVTVVDTKVPGWGQALIDKVREISSKPITHVINTHTHFDHAGGNPAFASTVEIVAHQNTARLMKEHNPVSGLTMDQPNAFKDSGGRGLPTRTFTDRLTVGSGTDRIDLYYFGRAHTSGDTFVVFPAARAMHTGDAFPNKGVPIMDANNGGSGLAYPETLARAAALPDIDTVITGHAPTTLTMADVREFVDYNREFVTAARAAKKAGQTVDQFVNSWKVPERFLKSGYTQPAPMAIRSNAQVTFNEIP